MDPQPLSHPMGEGGVVRLEASVLDSNPDTTLAVAGFHRTMGGLSLTREMAGRKVPPMNGHKHVSAVPRVNRRFPASKIDPVHQMPSVP